MNAQPNFESIVRATPEFQAATERAHEKTVLERQAHLDALAKLDSAATKAWPSYEKLRAESLAREQEALAALKAAAAEHQRVRAAVAAEQFAYESGRCEHEAALIAGEWPEISDFLETCEAKIKLAKAAYVRETRSVKNLRTGKTVRLEIANGASIAARVKAICASMREAPDLRLIADRRQLQARFAEIAASWPTVEQPRFPDEAAA